MGFLTDANVKHTRYTNFLINYHHLICILMYLSGIIYFVLLPHPAFIQQTYYSENALLAGLVLPNFKGHDDAIQYHDELQLEMGKYPNSLPSIWLIRKFQQLGLDTYQHNFTVENPVLSKGRRQVYSGCNVYGILRAPRAASTEALVLSVPYRPLNSMYGQTSASLALMLAFIKYARSGRYWAKDVIFLVTEHEQVGVHAWLEAYHGFGQEAGRLKGRGGAIQAALNLEIHNAADGHGSIEISGLNGQLPNLDLVNLAVHMCSKERLHCTYKDRTGSVKKPGREWLLGLKTVLKMMGGQIVGVPNGNHGLFLRYGIQAVTVESVNNPKFTNRINTGFFKWGSVIENILRGLNNLLERLHQSYFFYLLSSTDGFISIGLYMPALILIAGALLIKAYADWCLKNQLETSIKTAPPMDIEELQPLRMLIESDHHRPSMDGSSYPCGTLQRFIETGFVTSQIFHHIFNVTGFVATYLLLHLLGVALMYSPRFLLNWGGYYLPTLPNEAVLFYTFFFTNLLILPVLPVVLPLNRTNYKVVTLYRIICLIELGTVLIVVGLLNFGLGYLLAIGFVPLVLYANGERSRELLFLVHPLMMTMTAIVILTLLTFPERDLWSKCQVILAACQQALMFAVVDSYIYGNWFFGFACGILLPSWWAFWCLSFVPDEGRIEKVRLQNRIDSEHHNHSADEETKKDQ